ncbi:MAG TPA: O-antigen ligase family protein [Chitinophagaceae bacterium]|nr:O-antigen ligase family protein [Chitinophagaceae bacterium]
MVYILIAAIFLILTQIFKFAAIWTIAFPVLFLIACYLHYFVASKSFGLAKLAKTNTFLVIFIMLNVISILRSNDPRHDISYAAYMIFTISIFAATFGAAIFKFFNIKKLDSDTILKSFLYAVVLPYALFSAANFLLYFMGIRLLKSSAFNGDIVLSKAVMLSYFGINMKRIEFPFVNGFNSYAVYVGALLSITMPLATLVKKHRLITRGSSIIFVATILCTDSRAALITPILITIFLWFIRNKKDFSPGYRFLSLIIIVGPVLFLSLVPFLISTLGLEAALSRSSGDIESGNSRFLIWAICAAQFLAFKPMDIIGYGEFGHLGSGASKLWAYLFGSYNDAELTNPHNTMFSLIFDYGYIGLLVYICIVWQCLGRLRLIWQHNRPMAFCLFSFMLYALVAGISEALGGMYEFNFMLVFYMIVLVINIYYYLLRRRIAATEIAMVAALEAEEK